MPSIPTHGTLDININFPNEEGGTAAKPVAESGNAASPANIGLPNQENPAAASAGSVTLTAGVHVAMNLGQQAVNEAISNIGLATGNNYAQRKADSLIGAAGTVVGLAASMTNPITGVAAVGSLLISGISQIYRENKERMWENRQARNNAVLYGFSSDGGRE